MVAGQLLPAMSASDPAASARPLRVLHCPDVVGGLPGSLAKAERSLGIESWAVTFDPSKYDYPIDEILSPVGTPGYRRVLRRWGLLWRALSKYDIIHFNFGRTITPERTFDPANNGGFYGLMRRAYTGLFELRDLPLLKWFGKSVFVTYQGDDLRRGDFCETYFGERFLNDLPPGMFSPESDAHKRWRLSKFMRHADGMYAVNPDLMFLLPESARFIPYGHIDLDEWPCHPRPACGIEGPLVIHAPTHRGVKGTRYVLDAVEKLKAEGIAFRFKLVEGLTLSEARQLYEAADLLIDQLWLGWYGGLAVELMALGRPVICNIRQDGLKYLPAGMAATLPFIQAEPNSITDVLREWVTTRRDELPRKGQESRRFVDRWHNSVEVARSLVADYTTARSRRRG